jgi:hypothetical protein
MEDLAELLLSKVKAHPAISFRALLADQDFNKFTQAEIIEVGLSLIDEGRLISVDYRVPDVAIPESLLFPVGTKIFVEDLTAV